jgi:hypothetical protein
VLLLTLLTLPPLLLLLVLLPQWVAYLTWRRQLEMLAGVAAGMAHLHRWGQLRGDLRTSCVFVMPDGEVRCNSRKINLKQCMLVLQLRGDMRTLCLFVMPDRRGAVPDTVVTARLQHTAGSRR